MSVIFASERCVFLIAIIRAQRLASALFGTVLEIGRLTILRKERHGT